jgi:Protein of unknown function (DUF3467)
MDKQPDFKLELTAETAPGRYTNFAVISHQPNEFLFDFALVLPHQPALVVSRVLTSPRHAKAFMKALQENLQRYEAIFGTIEETVPPREPGTVTQTN